MKKDQDKAKVPENLNSVKEVKLYFSEDKFYKGELAYKKGTHNVETKQGWAQRWLSRGAKLVVGDSHVEVVIGEKGEVVPQGKPTEPPPPPQDPPKEDPPKQDPPAGDSSKDSTAGSGSQDQDISL